MRTILPVLGALPLLCLPAILPAQSTSPAAAAPAASSAPVVSNNAAARPTLPRAVPVAPSVQLPAGQLLLERDTMVRLMVTREINSRTARQGDKFSLRVDEPVTVSGQVLIPVGATALGEVILAEGTGGLGKAGRLGARLLHLDINGSRIPLSGEEQAKGARSTDRVVISALTFGVLGLFTKGNNAKLKAGDIINGYVAEDLIFDPAARSFVERQSSTSADGSAGDRSTDVLAAQ